MPDESLGFALRVCLDQLSGTIILESLPWDAIQLADLYRVAGDQVVVLHLNASDDLVTERRIGRQHCAACYPLTASASDGVHCDRCGGALTLRDDDDRAAFDERLQLHRVNAANVLALARDLQVPVVTLNATNSPAILASQALAVVRPAVDTAAA